MTKINWDNERRRRNGARAAADQERKPFLDLMPIPPPLASVFDMAEKRNKGGPHYAAVLSIKRQFQINGDITHKQKKYLSDLAYGRKS